MKFIFTILVVFSVFFVYGQSIIFSEDFNDGWPTGWTTIDGPSPEAINHWHHYSSLNTATVEWGGSTIGFLYDQDEWIVTPEISLPSTGSVRLNFMLDATAYWCIYIYDNEDFYVKVSTDGGTNWDTLLSDDDQTAMEAAGVEWPNFGYDWNEYSLDLTAYAGQDILIAWHYVRPKENEGRWINLDNVEVRNVVADDLELTSFSTVDYVLSGENAEFHGEALNVGENTVTSFDVIYRVEGVESAPYTVTCDIDNNFSVSFTHDLPFTFTDIMLHDLELEIVSVNGNTDPDDSNNILTRQLNVGSQSVQNVPMFEYFTGST